MNYERRNTSYEKRKGRFASDFAGRLTVRHFVRVERREKAGANRRQTEGWKKIVAR